MKKISFYLFPQIVLFTVLIFQCHSTFAQSVETSNPLEKRLDDLLAKMTTQEKIEQLYYLSDVFEVVAQH